MATKLQVSASEPVSGPPSPRSERGGSIEWSYRLEPRGAGTLLTLGYQVLRPVPVTLHVILRLLLGVRELRVDLHGNMSASLGRLTPAGH